MPKFIKATYFAVFLTALNSCLVGDGKGVDLSGNIDLSDPANINHPLCDSTNPEHACYCNDYLSGARPCGSCDTLNPLHLACCDSTNIKHKACYKRAIDYYTMVQPIFDWHCVVCHYRTIQIIGLGVLILRGDESFENLVNVKAHDSLTHPIWLVRPYSHDSSYIYHKINGMVKSQTETSCPQDDDPLPDSLISIIELWILEGAFEGLD